MLLSFGPIGRFSSRVGRTSGLSSFFHAVHARSGGRSCFGQLNVDFVSAHSSGSLVVGCSVPV